ncbi:MAG: FAD binding domain-containing protein [Gammaproteobacteria bacterium]
MTRFLLNREEITLGDSRADETVLDYLRERRRKCGSKEGCASGDCGACTVVVAEADGDALRYRAINSCIAFVGALHGMRLITVEDLADGDALHPVQRAMVEQHASQCGFCTPGFVMSLFALYKNQPAACDEKTSRRGVSQPGVSQPGVSRHTIEEALGGNLCRCTGYRPIIDAARQALGGVRADQFSREEIQIAKRLRAIAKTRPHASPLHPPKFHPPKFHLPKSAREAAELLQRHPAARLLAGGTDLALEVTQQLKSLDDIIYLGRVAELRRVRVVADGGIDTRAGAAHASKAAAKKLAQKTAAKHAHYEIGAALPLSECGAILSAEYPDLAELLRRFGSLQVRNQATLGGNIANASPIADLPPVLIALGAGLVLQRGERLRRVEVETFFRGYKKTALAKGEFIRSVLVPRATKRGRLFAYKISKRMDDDISAVCAVFWVEVDGARIAAARIAFGGMAATPKRALQCERALLGREFDEAALRAAAQALREDFTPISDARASASYRMTVSQNMLRRLRIELLAPETAARINSYAA